MNMNQMNQQQTKKTFSAYQLKRETLLSRSYSLRYRLIVSLIAIVIGVLVAGFWNYQAVDGFGREIVAGNIIGTESLSSSYAERGAGFGFVFAMVAGLAATFTACNCVVFAMLPSLSCATNSASRSPAWKLLMLFIAGVLIVNACYGFFIGQMDSAAVQAYNERDVRITQAQIIYSILGLIMMIWSFISFGYLSNLTSRISQPIYNFFIHPLTKAALMGVLVGFFSIGRPFPVFRDFITYAAASNNPLYSALAMTIQGLGQIAVLILLFVLVIFFFSKPISKWVLQKPEQAELISAVAFLTGAAYFIFYWGLAFLFDIGRWGFKLNLY